MTVLVGILCEDGVVIGSDSVMSFGNLQARTIEQTNAVKVHIIGSSIIVALTGWIGLSQRCVTKIRGLHNTDKLKKSDPIAQATDIASEMISDFQKTPSVLNGQPGHGWGLGCLMGMAVQNKPELFEFDAVTFNPERKGDPDPSGIDRNTRFVSMGSGQSLADPFLGFIRDAFWKDKDAKPRVADAKLAVGWTLQHTIDLNTGGVGGPIQLAVLEKAGNAWKARMIDAGQITDHVEELRKYIGKYREEYIAKSEGGGESALTPEVKRP